jgi:anaerobic ribonucleoside-triphosphate reductase activating protein
VDGLWTRIANLGAGIEGITITGGEPLQQAPALLDLLRRIRTQSPLSVILSTGYAWEEVQSLPLAGALLSCIDVLIAGRYDQSRRLAHGLRGSANKTVHYLTNRYSQADILSTPASELILLRDGEVTISGVDPLRWQREGKRTA